MKSALIFVGTLSLISLAAVGCSHKGSDGQGGAAANGPKGGSCMQDKAGLCTEYADNPAGMAESVCTSLIKGTYSKNACPRDNSLGSCLSKDDTTFYYFGNASGPWTEDATEDCKTIHEGTFTAVAGASEIAKQKALPTPDRILASCQHTQGSCDDYYGDPIKLAISKSLCEGDGTWADGKACPADGLAATCLSGGTAHRYYPAYLKSTSTSMTELEQPLQGRQHHLRPLLPGPRRSGRRSDGGGPQRQAARGQSDAHQGQGEVAEHPSRLAFRGPPSGYSQSKVALSL